VSSNLPTAPGEQRNILITGASGFLGSHLVKAVLTAGHQPLAYRRGGTDPWRLKDDEPRIEWFDLEAGELAKPFELNQIDAVFHAATFYGRNNEPASEVVDANVIFPLRVFEQAQKHFVPRFLNTDSFFTSAVGNYQYLQTYTRTKQQFVDWLASHTSSVMVLNMRLQHVYGPADDDSKFIPALLRRLAANEPHIALTAGAQVRDFIWVGDVVRAYLDVLEAPLSKPTNFDTFDVGTGIGTTIRVLGETAKEILRSSSLLGFGDLPYREGEIMSSVAEPAHLHEIGWSSKVDLREGLRRLVFLSGEKNIGI
jgi:nucleoside-diphosphate-sugar epimerase